MKYPKIKKNFWSGKIWHKLSGSVFSDQKVKLLSDGKTLEIICRDEHGIIRRGYYDKGRWIETHG